MRRTRRKRREEVAAPFLVQFDCPHPSRGACTDVLHRVGARAGPGEGALGDPHPFGRGPNGCSNGSNESSRPPHSLFLPHTPTFHPPTHPSTRTGPATCQACLSCRPSSPQPHQKPCLPPSEPSPSSSSYGQGDSSINVHASSSRLEVEEEEEEERGRRSGSGPRSTRGRRMIIRTFLLSRCKS